MGQGCANERPARPGAKDGRGRRPSSQEGATRRPEDDGAVGRRSPIDEGTAYGSKENEGWEERHVEDQWVPRPAPTEGMRKRFVPDNAAGRKSQEEMGLPRNLFARERLKDTMEDGKRSFKMREDLDVGWDAQSASRASDRDWKAAQADLDRAKLPEIRPGRLYGTARGTDSRKPS
jgi:hypothetical protein